MRRSYQAHRLAWLYMTGDWPPNEINHENRASDDNKWANLRLATHGQNQRNSMPRGVSRFKGVYWFKRDKKWRTIAKLNGKNHLLGYHDTEESAAAAYAAFSAEHFPKWARLV